VVEVAIKQCVAWQRQGSALGRRQSLHPKPARRRAPGEVARLRALRGLPANRGKLDRSGLDWQLRNDERAVGRSPRCCGRSSTPTPELACELVNKPLAKVAALLEAAS